MPVGIVGPATVTGQVEQALGHGHQVAFNLRAYPSVSAARTAIAHQDIDGALVAGRGSMRLLIAQAGGTGPAQALTRTFTAVAARSGRALAVTDIAPPLAGDTEALSPFFVVLGVLFPSLAAGSASALVFRRARPAWCVAAPVTVAIAAGAIAAGIADGVSGLGNYAAIAGIVALFSLAVSAPTAALGRLWPPLVSLAVLVFMVLGIPASGGPGSLGSFGPAFLRVLHPALPLGAAADAVRGAVYFGGFGTAAPAWVLTAWAAAGIIALILTATLRRPAAARVLPPPSRLSQYLPVPAASLANGRATAGRPVTEPAAARPAGPGSGGAPAGRGGDAPGRSPAGRPVPAGSVATARHDEWPVTGGAEDVAAGDPRVGPLAAQADPGQPGLPGSDRGIAPGSRPASWNQPAARPARPPGTPGADPAPGVVVGFDNSVPAQRALAWAARQAAARRVTLHIIYADQAGLDSDLSGFAYAELAAARDEEASAVERAAAQIVAGAGVPYTFEQREGAPADAILAGASARAAVALDGSDPVIVVGRSGRAAHHVLGSVPVRLLHRSPYPVLAIP